MNRIIKKTFVALSVGVLFLLFLLLIGGRLFPEKEAATTNADKIDTINWEERFPYRKRLDIPEATIAAQDLSDEFPKQTDKSFASIIHDYRYKFGNIGTILSHSIYKREEITSLALAVRLRLEGPPQVDNRIRLENGYWISLSETKLNYQNAEADLRNYAVLQEYLKDAGVSFLYCYTPRKTCAINEDFPQGVVDYTNENIDVHIQALNNLGVANIDLRKKLHDDGLNHYSMFYKTDHHWTIEAGFWAADKIENEISKRFGIKMNAHSDMGTYTRKTYDNAMFGSDGQSVTHALAQSEDFSILFPDFKTNFRIEIPDKEIDCIGSFDEVFFDYPGLEKAVKDGGSYAYQNVLFGNRPYERITNLLNPNGPRILMIKDSFGIAAAPYLALSSSELILLDTRPSNGNFSGSIVTCIDEFHPDIVIAVQNYPQAITLNKD